MKTLQTRRRTAVRFATIGAAALLLAGCLDGGKPREPAKYSVGGTVSGLTGSVTLVNVGGDPRTVTANGSFTFATQQPAGTAYTVTVQAQPANQQCIVTNGSGTVGAAAVTNVSVACQTLRVTGTVGASGGTITGPDGVQVEIPAGALAQDTTIGIAKSAVGAPALPSTSIVLDATYEFTPHDLVFAKPVTIRMPYSSGGNTQKILMASRGEEWREIDATFAAGVATFQRSTFSWGGYYGACSYTEGVSPPDACAISRGAVRLTSTVPSALQQTGAAFGFVSYWNVTAATTLQFRFTYVVPTRCGSAFARIRRAPLASDGTYAAPAPVIAEQTAPLTLASLPYPFQSYTGSTQIDLPVDDSQNGRWAYFAQIVCTENTSTTRFYGGDVQIVTVDVPKPAVTYTIGGTVTGLAGTGLVLRNNGGDALNVTSNGAFTFTTPVAAGGAYAVTVGTQPTNPTQTCTVQNGAGTAQAAVTNVAVTCTTATTKSWRTPGPIESNSAPAGLLQLGYDAAGNGIAIWRSSVSDPVTSIRTTEVWANRYTPAAGWGTPVRITRFTDGNVQDLSLAVRADGGAVAVWVQDTTYDLYTTVFTPASGWSAVTTIENRPERVRTPMVAGDPSGTVFAIWNQDTGPAGTRDVWAARYTPATGWGAPVPLETSDSGPGRALIAVSANGEAIAVWKQVSAGLSYNRFTQGAWGTANLIPATPDADDALFAVAIDDAGRAVVAYASTTGAVKAARFTAGTWSPVNTLGPTPFTNVWTLGIAMRGSGEALITWGAGAGFTQVWAQPYGVLGGTLESFDNGGPAYPVAAPAPDGTFLVLWTSRGDSSVRARRFDPAAQVAWQSIETVATGVLTDAPQVAVDPFGDAIAVWVQDGPAGTDIAANVYR